MLLVAAIIITELFGMGQQVAAQRFVALSYVSAVVLVHFIETLLDALQFCTTIYRGPGFGHATMFNTFFFLGA
jgi:hypothetical protein